MVVARRGIGEGILNLSGSEGVLIRICSTRKSVFGEYDTALGEISPESRDSPHQGHYAMFLAPKMGKGGPKPLGFDLRPCLSPVRE